MNSPSDSDVLALARHAAATWIQEALKQNFTLTRATALFPDDAEFEFSLAQFLYNTGRTEEAYTRGRAAVDKGGLNKPGQARIYLAYLAYELQRYKEAMAWVDAAREAGGVPASTLDPLASAIREAQAVRQAVQPL